MNKEYELEKINSRSDYSISNFAQSYTFTMEIFTLAGVKSNTGRYFKNNIQRILKTILEAKVVLTPIILASKALYEKLPKTLFFKFFYDKTLLKSYKIF